MHIGIVKTSSMGDVIHALPVLSDLKKAHPGVRVDWVVESSFAEIPGWHPAVSRVIPVSVRRWRRQLTSPRTWREMRGFRSELQRIRPYDLVLDLQGLYKSAALTLMMYGPRAGFSWSCAREPLASLAYTKTYSVDMKAHAIERLRQLAGAALGYSVQGLPQFEFALDAADPAGAYLVLLQATSRDEKRWPVEQWRALIAGLARRGLRTVLPWAGERERTQALEIASVSSLSQVPGAVMSLTECARLLRGACAVVGVDTGLTHLAAALGRPTVSVFGATEAWRFGPYWSDSAINLGKPGHWPLAREVLDALAPWLDAAPAASM